MSALDRCSRCGSYRRSAVADSCRARNFTLCPFVVPKLTRDVERPERGPRMNGGESHTVKDGVFTVTWCYGAEAALVTVRGKDHDMTEAELREFARVALHAADSLKKTAP